MSNITNKTSILFILFFSFLAQVVTSCTLIGAAQAQVTGLRYIVGTSTSGISVPLMTQVYNQIPVYSDCQTTAVFSAGCPIILKGVTIYTTGNLINYSNSTDVSVWTSATISGVQYESVSMDVTGLQPINTVLNTGVPLIIGSLIYTPGAMPQELTSCAYSCEAVTGPVVTTAGRTPTQGCAIAPHVDQSTALCVSGLGSIVAGSSGYLQANYVNAICGLSSNNSLGVLDSFAPASPMFWSDCVSEQLFSYWQAWPGGNGWSVPINMTAFFFLDVDTSWNTNGVIKSVLRVHGYSYVCNSGVLVLCDPSECKFHASFSPSYYLPNRFPSISVDPTQVLSDHDFGLTRLDNVLQTGGTVSCGEYQFFYYVAMTRNQDLDASITVSPVSGSSPTLFQSSLLPNVDAILVGDVVWCLYIASFDMCIFIEPPVAPPPLSVDLSLGNQTTCGTTTSTSISTVTTTSTVTSSTSTSTATLGIGPSSTSTSVTVRTQSSQIGTTTLMTTTTVSAAVSQTRTVRTTTFPPFVTGTETRQTETRVTTARVGTGGDPGPNVVPIVIPVVIVVGVVLVGSVGALIWRSKRSSKG